MIIKGRPFFFLPVLLAVVLGCSQRNPNAPATVTGSVSYKGEPLTAGSVSFHLKDGANFSAGITSDGTYTAAQVPAGEAVITVETESANTNRPQMTYGGARGKDKMMTSKPRDMPTVQGKYRPIPRNYADPAKSPLKETIKPGKQTINIEVKD